MADPSPRFTTWFSRLRDVQVPMSLLVSLAVLTGAAWSLTIYQAVTMDMPMGIAARGGMAADGMAGMAMGGIMATGWSLQSAAIFVVLWTGMMVAMMLPAAAPMIVIFAAAQARRTGEVAVPTWIFVAGYFLVWAAVGVVVYALVQMGSDLAAGFAPPERSRWAPIALGITVAAAGLYQFTPLKRFCLRHCRSPLAFVAQHWREGRIGALTMGFQHGAYCLGCCWALFAVMVAAGVMSLAWMLLLALVVLVEKTFPHGRRFGAVIGLALIGLGIVVASGTAAMPWLA